jgi:hypothetical protein
LQGCLRGVKSRCPCSFPMMAASLRFLHPFMPCTAAESLFMRATGYEVLAATALCSQSPQSVPYRCDSVTICGISVLSACVMATLIITLSAPNTDCGTSCVLPLAQAYSYCNSDPACGGVSVCGDENCAYWNSVIKYGGTLFGVPPNVAVCSANNPDWASYRKCKRISMW